jgi:hypothetical protein
VTVSVKLISPITSFTITGEDSTSVVSVPMLLQQTATLNNVFVGGGGTYNTTGYDNTALGYLALNVNTTGSRNTAIGWQTLAVNTYGFLNVAMGYQALISNTTGSENTVVGASAATAITTGTNNTAIGYSALSSNSTGGSNTAIGQNALQLVTSGGSNTAVGLDALQNIATNSSNTAVGASAGKFITGGSTAFTGSTSTFLGYQAYANGASDTNETVIGNAAVGAGSNTVTLGNSSVTGVYSTAATFYGLGFVASQSGLGTTTAIGSYLQNPTLSTSGTTVQVSPDLQFEGHCWNTTATAADNFCRGRMYVLPVSGTSPSSVWHWQNSADTGTASFTDAMTLTSGGNLTVQGTLQQQTEKSCSTGLTTDASGNINGCVASDERQKENLLPLQANLNAFMDIQTWTYDWKDKAIRDDLHHAGFVAQQIQKVFPLAVVNAGGDHNIGVDPNAVSALTVRVVQGHEHRLQDEQHEIDELKARLAILESHASSYVQQ